MFIYCSIYWFHSLFFICLFFIYLFSSLVMPLQYYFKKDFLLLISHTLCVLYNFLQLQEFVWARVTYTACTHLAQDRQLLFQCSFHSDNQQWTQICRMIHTSIIRELICLKRTHHIPALNSNARILWVIYKQIHSNEMRQTLIHICTYQLLA